MVQSRIFVRNRVLGHVSNHIPLVTRYILRRKEHYVVTCVGREFHTYGCKHFTLLSVSGMHADDITCLATDTFHVYTASANKVYAWRRGTELKHTYEGHDCAVHILLPFGAHLLSIDENSTLKVWNIKDESLILELNFSNNVFKITTLIHPNTYMNKILMGSEQGQLQLWNIKSMKMIYTFKGWHSSVTALEQAPAIDVAAIGLNDGRIILHNLKYDETLFELVQDWGPVVSISFRTDSHPIMATGSLGGQIVFWNLEQRTVENQLCNAHHAAVTGLRYIPNEPLLVSSSPDNSLKLWIFDLADGAGRLLRIREGHAEPPTIVRFYGNDGNYLLTTGGDSSLRLFSTVTEILNKSLGKASFNRKASKKKSLSVDDPLLMPPITELAFEVTREKEWCNIAATHSGLGVVTTWSSHLQKMGDLKLLPERFKNNYNANASSLCLTRCGNFVVIGYNTGHVDRFNIQSGIHRASYGNQNGAHEGSVKGIMVDDLNQTVITAGRDAKIKFWDFKPSKGMTTARTILTLEESIEWIRYHNESSLVAVALENFDIVLMDLDTRKIVRHFQGHEGRLTDACFNPNSRWLITASMDCTIRTWDIPSSHLIDIFQVPEACISLNFSPTAEFLATAHVRNMGIFLWSNRMLYSHVSLKAISKDDIIPEVLLPGSSVEAKEKIEEDDVVAAEPDYTSPDQLDSDLITMSAVAQSRWQNLLDIDIIKRRNKPQQPPKAPETAPFFLPTIPSLQLRFDFTDVKNADKTETPHVHSTLQNFTSFNKSLQSTTTTDNFIDAIEKLKAMNPSDIDFEIQSLSLDESSAELSMLQFMKMLHYMIKRQTDFELSQAYLAVFLKWHGTTISENGTLRDYLRKIQEAQMNNWLTLREKLFYNLSIVQNLKKM
ncbi:WD repeat-containing protein 36 [Cataglyphis hispanica]|uniref:WD repeat-containing protein 36 n=1 Tax=Cataglyphis hispanica TaxID=1086592 RepID=UPI00217FEAA2|nr:WD repeat-containing protein 36 [Cataglyphis hispanica]